MTGLISSYSVHKGSSAAARTECLEQLSAMGVSAKADDEGKIEGRLWLDIRKLPCIGGIGLSANVTFTCTDYVHLVFDDTTALKRLGPVPFLDLTNREGLTQRVVEGYERVAVEAESALKRARQLTPSAQFLLNPARIEGSVSYGGERIVLLFSSKGHRACIFGIEDRAVMFLPAEPRIVLSSDAGPPGAFEPRWEEAVAQARTCLGDAPTVTEEDHQHSIDLVSRDLTPDDALALDASTSAEDDLPVDSLDLASDDLPL